MSVNDPVGEIVCKEFVEFVTAFLEVALDPADERRFVDHLSLCDGCDRYLDQMRQTTRMLGELPADELPADRLDPREREALLARFREQTT